MTRDWFVWVIVAVQVICAVFFVAEIVRSVLGVAPIAWQLYEFIEIGAGVGLVLGVMSGIILLRRSRARTAQAENQLRLAAAAFGDVLNERFAAWGLTPAERDVALFAIKGMSTQEIAQLRAVSEGTIKAQTNAIYRKAGVTGRSQLLSLFIEDMMADLPASGGSL